MEKVNSSIIQNITNNITKYMIILLFAIYVIMEIITITKFTFDYNYNYNYGKKLKHACNNKNIEFETDRYQLYNNILNNIVQNTTNSSYNYIIFLSIILIFAIIFGLLITYILYNYINDIISIDKNNSDKFKLFCYLMMIMICGFCLIIVPLYIGYHFDKNNQFKLDIFDRYVKYGEYLIGILITIMVIVNMNLYKIQYHYNYGNNFVITMSLLFYLCLYLTKSVISFYKKKINIINYKNEDIKSHHDFINNFLKTELDTNSNVFNEYLSKLFNIDYNKIDLNFYTSILIIALILITILLIFNRTKTLQDYIKGTIDYKKLIECLLYNDNFCNNFLFEPKETRIIYNFIVLPIVFILLITITINSTINYNEVINKNLILNPLIIYKTEIDNVNNSFTNILHNDKFAYKEKKSVDRNIANTILLVLYNEIFSDMLLMPSESPETTAQNMTDKWIEVQEEEGTSVGETAVKEKNEIFLKEVKDEIKENKDRYKINILPKFKYIFNNKKEILDYNKLDEYNINNYLENECGDNIFVSKNLNSECHEVNRFILFYLIRSVFLYKPIADIDDDKQKHDTDDYDFYEKILKYKIYKSLVYYKNEKNYLGNAKLNDNNYEKNCTLNIKYEHPKITKEELLILLGKLIQKLKEENIGDYEKIFKNNINTNETKEKIYQQIQDLIANIEYSDLATNKELIDTYIDLNINKSDAHMQLLNDRIDKIKFNNDLIKKHESTIDTAIDHFITYITQVQIAYYNEFKTSDDTLTIRSSDLHDIFRKGEGNNKDKINGLIETYKKIIKRNFDNINDVLSNHEIGENEYHKQNNVTNYLLNNYNLSNNNRIKTYVEKINKESYKNSRLLDNSGGDPNKEDTIHKNIKTFMESIIISFYYNHYFILELKNKYSDRYLKSLVNSVKSLYENNDDNKKYKELKKEYIIKINELIIILKYTLDNTISNGNTDKISDYIKKSSVNKYIVDELIKFDENNDNKKIILNENIDNIKDFVENTENIKNFLENKDASRDNFNYDDLITNEYVNNIKGIYNKIEFFVSYIEYKEIKSSKYNEKNIEFINNMLMEQKNLLEIISNADVNKLNFNSVLKEFKYLEKFDNIISDYNNYYREYYNIELKNLIKEQNEQDEKSTYTNSSDKEKSNIVYKNANIASNMVLLLLTIYIIILYLLIKI